jgi:O-antigen/teichoic acid export membrane protein
MRKVYAVVSKFTKNLLLYLAKGGFLKNAAKLGGSMALSQAILILASLVLTRLYTPENFGVLAIFTSLYAQAVVLTSFCYEWNVPLEPKEDDAIDVLVFSLVCTIFTSIVLAIIIGIYGHNIALWEKSPASEPFLWLLPVLIFFGGLYQNFNQWSIREKAFGLMARTKLAQSVWTTGVQIVLGLFSPSSLGLLVGYVFTQIVGIWQQAAFFWSNHHVQIKLVSVPRIVAVGRKYFTYALTTSTSESIYAAGSAVPSLLLASFYGTSVVGSFSVAQRMISIPGVIIGMALSQVFLSHTAELIRNDPRELKRLFVRTSLLLFVVSLLIGMIMLTSPFFFPIIFGKGWIESGFMAQAMVPMFILSMAISPVSILEWVGKQKWKLAWSIVRLGLFTAGFWVAHLNNWSATTAILIHSVIAAMMYLGLWGLNFYSIYLLNLKQPILAPVDEV